MTKSAPSAPITLIQSEHPIHKDYVVLSFGEYILSVSLQVYYTTRVWGQVWGDKTFLQQILLVQ